MAEEEIFITIFSLIMLGITSLFMIAYFLFIFAIIILSIGSMVVWILMLIDVIQRKEEDFPDTGEYVKLMWLLIILLTGIIGAGIYYFIVKRKMDELKSQTQTSEVPSKQQPSQSNKTERVRKKEG